MKRKDLRNIFKAENLSLRDMVIPSRLFGYSGS